MMKAIVCIYCVFLFLLFSLCCFLFAIALFRQFNDILNAIIVIIMASQTCSLTFSICRNARAKMRLFSSFVLSNSQLALMKFKLTQFLLSNRDLSFGTAQHAQFSVSLSTSVHSFCKAIFWPPYLMPEEGNSKKKLFAFLFLLFKACAISSQFVENKSYEFHYWREPESNKKMFWNIHAFFLLRRLRNALRKTYEKQERKVTKQMIFVARKASRKKTRHRKKKKMCNKT